MEKLVTLVTSRKESVWNEFPFWNEYIVRPLGNVTVRGCHVFNQAPEKIIKVPIDVVVLRPRLAHKAYRSKRVRCGNIPLRKYEKEEALANRVVRLGFEFDKFPKATTLVHSEKGVSLCLFFRRA